ncbi:MAG: homoserine dehydrogenase [Candidatus Flexifilum sp.]|jgi:homoserine dehydrogenase
MRIVLIGLGTVGQGLLEILRDRSDFLREHYRFQPQIVAVSTRTRGSLYHPDGLDLTALLEHARDLRAFPDRPGLERGRDALWLAQHAQADVLVEATPTDLRTGQPALDVCRAALAAGKHVVTANKGPVAVAYAELRERAQAAGRAFLFEGTVMAGTPSIRLAQEALAGCVISRARGILNGTTNYILTQMESGMSYADALAQAQALGYAETDPTADVDGWDAAGKGIILAAALFGVRLTLDQMAVRGISQITLADIEAARAAGERWKLIVDVTPDGGSVQPVRLPLTHPLTGVSGSTNAVTYTTDLLGDVTLIGSGAGRVQTGFALLADLLAIQRQFGGSSTRSGSK